jgi:hypothetical protein
MSPEVTAAIITSVCAVVGPIITYIATKAYQDGIFQRPGRRAKVLAGKWQGTLHEENGPEGKPFDAPF